MMTIEEITNSLKKFLSDNSCNPESSIVKADYGITVSFDKISKEKVGMRNVVNSSCSINDGTIKFSIINDGFFVKDNALYANF